MNDTTPIDLEVYELRKELTEIKESFAFVMSEKCPADEMHCGCVPILRELCEQYKGVAQELAETSHVKEYSLIPRFIKAVAKLEALNKTTL